MQKSGLVALMMAAALVTVPLAQQAPAGPAGKPPVAPAKLDALKQEVLADVESRAQFSQQNPPRPGVAA